MFEIYGSYTGARIFADVCESDAISQLYDLCNHPIFAEAKIRIMPDVHAGVGATVGTTIEMKRRALIPSIVGTDIGCGVLITLFETDAPIDFAALDAFVSREIPSGMSIRDRRHPALSKQAKEAVGSVVEDLKMYKSEEAFLRACGSLGGGNHYIEVGKLEDGRYALSIHSGSRALGKCVCEYFSDRAKAYVDRVGATGFKRSMPYIEEEDYELYLKEMLRTQAMAAENRRLMTKDILSHLGVDPVESFDTIHNYVEVKRDGGVVIRKGAISAAEGQRLAIPLNMRDGVIIGTGRGNPDWNCSAPHGAGRLLSRSAAKESISLADFEEAMKGIATWSVTRETLDESPMAYKDAATIVAAIGDTVKVDAIAKPVYNFKAHMIKK